MKPKSFILFALAAGCGLVAMMGVKQVMSSNKGGDNEEEMVKVLYAKSDIQAHIPLDENLVEFREVKKSAAQFGAVTSREEYDGRALRTAAVKDEPIMKAKLSEKGAFDASNRIKPGMRLVSIPVNLTTSHSGLLRPGDRVDILATYDVSGNSQKSVTTTRTVLEYVEVFAVDSLVEGNDPNQHDILAKNVSLLVTPDEAQILTLAQKEGTFHLALRGKKDNAIVKLDAINERDLQDGVSSRNAEEQRLASAVQDGQKRQGELANKLAELQKKYDEACAKLEKIGKSAPDPSNRKIWTVKVYANDTVSTAEFDLEEGKTPEPPQPAKEAI